MSQKKDRQERLAAKVEQVRTYVYAEQYAIRALLKAVPREVIGQRPPLASVGRCEIWPCADAAVVLIFPNYLDSIEVVVRESSSKKHDDFMTSAGVRTFCEEDGTPVSWRPVVVINDAEHHMVDTADIVVDLPSGKAQPRFQRLMILGWEATLPGPDDEALKVVQSDIAAQNLAAQESLSRAEIKERALNLSQAFRDLIETAHREVEALEEARESARRELAELASWHERLQALERDKELFLDSYATRAPEALDSSDPRSVARYTLCSAFM